MSESKTHKNKLFWHYSEGKSVSEMARTLGVSRSSLKDYIESRELKQVAQGSLLPKVDAEAEEQVIRTITCPNQF